MRKITADYIFPVSSPPIRNGVVVLDDSGIVLEVISGKEQGSADAERFEGVIVPGFVNTHCHLELSHLKGQVSEKTGLTGFISELIVKRDKFSVEEIKSAIAQAEEEMVRSGIVAVGDISNNDHSFEQKRKGRITYHTFLEVFDLDLSRAQNALDTARLLQAPNVQLRTSITPHAPYSVSGKLMEMTDNLKQPVLSIHNQESASENEMFLSGTGPLAEMMKNAGVDVETKSRAKSPLLYTFGGLLESQKILLVHNTFTSAQDLELLGTYLQGGEQEVVFCFCPRANLYIENRLPDVPMFLEAGMKITLGTDSYASNWSLSIFEEMKTIAKSFPEIPFETLLLWATRNGAEVLGFEKELGSIEKGKKPGLNLITGLDLNKNKLSGNSEVKKLI